MTTSNEFVVIHLEVINKLACFLLLVNLKPIAHDNLDLKYMAKDTPKLNILQILPELESGGVERGTVDVAKALKNEGFIPYVASSGGILVKYINAMGGKHFELPLKSKNPLTIYRNISKLARIIEENNINIVHARSRAPAWSAYFAAKKSKKKFITTFHGVYSFQNVIKKIYNSVMTKGYKIIAVSEYVRQHIIENYNIEPHKVVTIHRGVDLKSFDRDIVIKDRLIKLIQKLQLEQDVPVILLPGRITRWKGHNYLLDSLELIKDKNFTCLFAGRFNENDNYKAELEAKIAASLLKDRVKFIGDVQDMPALYCLCDIVISASLRPEAFGRVVMEGQAMERLVIATDHGGSRETIIDGKTGWLAPLKDKEKFAQIIKEVLELDLKQRKKITKAAKDHVFQNFSLQKMTDKTLAIYKDIIN